MHTRRITHRTLLGCVIAAYWSVAWPEITLTTLPNPNTAAYISEALEIPLRAGASERFKIIATVRGGMAVTIVRVDTAKGYSQIRTATGLQGWLPSAQLADKICQGDLLQAQTALVELQTRYADLQKHMESFVTAPGTDAPTYSQLYEESVSLRQQLAEYRKVAADAVAVDDRNKSLQEQTVTLERELRLAQQEAQTLRHDNDTLRLLIGTLAIIAGAIFLFMIPRMREYRRAQWRRL